MSFTVAPITLCTGRSNPSKSAQVIRMRVITMFSPFSGDTGYVIWSGRRDRERSLRSMRDLIAPSRLRYRRAAAPHLSCVSRVVGTRGDCRWGSVQSPANSGRWASAEPTSVADTNRETARSSRRYRADARGLRSEWDTRRCHQNLMRRLLRTGEETDAQEGESRPHDYISAPA